MILTDMVTVEDAAVRFTREGFLVAPVRAARTGIQAYTASELELKDRDPAERINVYRSPEEVFSVDSLRSFSMIDATIDHPKGVVDAKNWRDLAVGSVGESALRDGEFLVLPLVLKDQQAIDAWRGGKKQLSVGYECEIVLGDGVTPAGEAYQARQTTIRANHLALCDVARGGPALRIGDSPVPLKTIMFDGVPVAEVSDAAEAVITKLQGQLADAKTTLTTAEGKLGELTATIATKDGEIAGLNAKLEDAKVTPAKLQEMANARAKTVADAKAIAPNFAVTDAMTEVEIKRGAVVAKLGDAAKDMSDDAVAGAFRALVPATQDAADPLANVIADGAVSTGDADKAAKTARDAMIAEMKGEKVAA